MRAHKSNAITKKRDIAEERYTVIVFWKHIYGGVCTHTHIFPVKFATKMDLCQYYAHRLLYANLPLCFPLYLPISLEIMDIFDKIWFFGFGLSGLISRKKKIQMLERLWCVCLLWGLRWIFFQLCLALLSFIDQWIILANTDFPFI